MLIKFYKKNSDKIFFSAKKIEKNFINCFSYSSAVISTCSIVFVKNSHNGQNPSTHNGISSTFFEKRWATYFIFSGTNKLQKLEDALGRNRGDTTHGWHGTGDTEDTSDRGDRGDNGDKGDSEDRGDKGQIFPTIANIVWHG